MSTSKPSTEAGESGHQGHDRQPGKDAARSHQPTPGPGDTASPAQVQKRSKEATAQPDSKKPDQLHPRPESPRSPQKR